MPLGIRRSFWSCLADRRQESRAPIAGISEAQSLRARSNSPFKPAESESVCHRHPMMLCDCRQEMHGGVVCAVGDYIKYSQINENNIDTFNTPSVETPHHGDPEPRYRG